MRMALQDVGGAIGLDASNALVGAGAGLSASLQQDAVAALRDGALPQSTFQRDLRAGGPLTLLGDEQPRAAFGVIAPVATIVRDARPVLRWQAHPRARGYTIGIFTDRLERVATSRELTGTAWTPDVALQPGITYQWQVTALTPDGPALTPAPPQPEARFRVLAATQRQTLDQQLAEAGSSNLLRGLALTRAGVLDEAEVAFSALAAANPSSPAARDLLAATRRLRGSAATPPQR